MKEADTGQPTVILKSGPTAKGYGVTLNFIPRSPDAELVISAIEPKPDTQAVA